MFYHLIANSKFTIYLFCQIPELCNPHRPSFSLCKQNKNSPNLYLKNLIISSFIRKYAQLTHSLILGHYYLIEITRNYGVISQNQNFAN